MAMPRARRPPPRDSVYRAGFDGPALRGTARRQRPYGVYYGARRPGAAGAHRRGRAAHGLCLPSLQESSDITTPGGRAKALEDALTLIYPLRDSYMIDTYFIQIADLLGLDLETVRASSGRVFRDVAKREDAERRREQDYERQRAQAERSGSAGGRASGSRDAGRGAWASGATPPVSAPVEEEPYDYVPLDAYDAAPVEVVDDLPPIDVPDGMGSVPVPDGSDAPATAAPMVLTDLERKSLAGERELLTMLTSYPTCSARMPIASAPSSGLTHVTSPSHGPFWQRHREPILQPAWMRRARCVPRRQRL